jgi:hypothetical protein
LDSQTHAAPASPVMHERVLPHAVTSTQAVQPLPCVSHF